MIPGISPFKAKVRKQILHISNFLKYPRGLPHKGHRLYFRVENLGSLLAFAIKDFLAIAYSLTSITKGHT